MEISRAVLDIVMNVEELRNDVAPLHIVVPVLMHFLSGRLLRYWLKGPKAMIWEVWIDLPGVPDNVRRNENRDLWVAFNGKRMFLDMYSGAVPWLCHFVAKLPIPSKYLYEMLVPKSHALIIRYSSQDEVVEVLEDQPGKVVKVVSQVEEHDGKLYMGSVLYP